MIEKTKRVVWCFAFFLRRNHRWFSRFPLFFSDHPSFSRKAPTFFGKSPTFFGKSPTFLSKLPTFFHKTPFFFSKSSPYPSTKKSKFGEKYSQDRRTPFLLPFYFLVSLCFTRQFVKVVKAKSAKFLYVRARVNACALIITITRNDNDN